MEFLLEALALQQRASETGQKLMALETETGMGCNYEKRVTSLEEEGILYNTSSESNDTRLCNKLLRAKSNDSSSTGGYISASSLDLSSCESFEDDNNNDYTRFDYSDFALYDESTDELDLSMVDFEDVDMDTLT
ncbi:hypothetical protein L2E82_10256 [Cichorium intybus]|uniref:Uncharacterized protein n=1 Tax=Cichorium intybus TaxID=13427 RepID=A0ACB9GB93_CICIN|nr:hypothetical protein L2E82_10256 [Cichorium intybus]